MNWAARPRSRGLSGLTYFEQGAGPAVVLIHGVGLRADAWLGVVPVLSARLRVIAVDMPGHGAAPLNGAETLADFVQALSDFTDGIDGPFCLAGHSMGALLAMELAARKPDKVAALAALNAVHRRSPAAANAVRSRAQALRDGAGRNPEETLARWFGAAPSASVAESAAACRRWLTDGAVDGYAAAYTVFAESDGCSDETLSRLACPALYMTGADDPNSTPSMSQALAAATRAGTAHVISDAAHMLPMTHGRAVGHVLADLFEHQIFAQTSKGV